MVFLPDSNVLLVSANVQLCGQRLWRETLSDKEVAMTNIMRADTETGMVAGLAFRLERWRSERNAGPLSPTPMFPGAAAGYTPGNGIVKLSNQTRI